MGGGVDTGSNAYTSYILGRVVDNGMVVYTDV